MVPAVKSASFLILPGKSPGNGFISWSSVTLVPGLTTVESLSDWLDLDLKSSLLWSRWKGVVPQRDAEQMKRKERMEEEGRKADIWLLQTHKSLMIR